MHAKRTVSAISSLGVAALLGCASQALAQTAVPEAAGLETRSPSRGTVLAPPATLSGATDNRALFTTTQKGQAAAASFQIDNLQPVRDSTPAVLGVNLGPSDGSSSAGIGVEGQGGRYGLAGYGTSQDATGVVARGGFTGVDASGDRIGVNASGGFVGVEATGDFNGVIGTATFVDNAEGGTGVLGSGFIGVAGSSDSGSAAVFTGGAEGGGSCTYSGGAGWSCTSDRNQKENFHPINPRTILEKLSIVEISGWTMKGDKQRTPTSAPPPRISTPPSKSAATSAPSTPPTLRAWRSPPSRACTPKYCKKSGASRSCATWWPNCRRNWLARRWCWPIWVQPFGARGAPLPPLPAPGDWLACYPQAHRDAHPFTNDGVWAPLRSPGAARPPTLRRSTWALSSCARGNSRLPNPVCRRAAKLGHVQLPHLFARPLRDTLRKAVHQDPPESKDRDRTRCGNIVHLDHRAKSQAVSAQIGVIGFLGTSHFNHPITPSCLQNRLAQGTGQIQRVFHLKAFPIARHQGHSLSITHSQMESEMQNLWTLPSSLGINAGASGRIIRKKWTQTFAGSIQS